MVKTDIFSAQILQSVLYRSEILKIWLGKEDNSHFFQAISTFIYTFSPNSLKSFYWKPVDDIMPWLLRWYHTLYTIQHNSSRCEICNIYAHFCFVNTNKQPKFQSYFS